MEFSDSKSDSLASDSADADEPLWLRDAALAVDLDAKRNALEKLGRVAGTWRTAKQKKQERRTPLGVDIKVR